MELTSSHRAFLRFRQNYAAVASALVLAVLFVVILVRPLVERTGLSHFAPRALVQSPTALSEAQFNEPSAEHWLGSDMHGRDLTSRVLYGAGISLLVGLVGACVSLVIGVLWGATAGYVGGRYDDVMMRIVDVLYSLPSIVLVIVLITTVEGFFRQWVADSLSSQWAGAVRFLFLFVGLGSVSWLNMARIVRGEVLSLRTRAFVEASRALGATHVRLIARHILPNISGIIIVYLALTIPSVVLYESFLSFLGLGIQPPQASLGSLLSDGVAQINSIRVYWWMIVFPGGVLTGLLLALSFVADGLRDAFDPRSSR